MTKKCFAAIDLGTNSCRLLIADAKGKAVFKDVEPLRMGKNMTENMCFTDEAFNRGIEHFKKLANIMSEYNIIDSRFVATAGCRMAGNGQEFIDAVKKETGIELETIDTFEEARLALKGAVANVSGKSKYVMVLDIGGGSSELTLATNEKAPEIIKTISIPLGSRNATEMYNLSTYSDENAKKLADEVSLYLNRFKEGINYNKYAEDLSFIGVSSSALRLGALVKNNGEYDREALDGETFAMKDVDKAVKSIYKMNAQELKDNPYLGDRADMFVAPCVIFKTIYDELQPKEMTVSLRSAKDGIIEDLIEKDNNKWQSLRSQQKQSQVGIV